MGLYSADSQLFEFIFTKAEYSESLTFSFKLHQCSSSNQVTTVESEKRALLDKLAAGDDKLSNLQRSNRADSKKAETIANDLAEAKRYDLKLSKLVHFFQTPK